MSETKLLEMNDITKAFSSNIVLNGVKLSVLTNIENKGQQPSLQVFYDLVTRYHISVDQFFFPNKNVEKSTNRRQLDALLDGMSDKGIRIVTATAREITEVEKTEG